MLMKVRVTKSADRPKRSGKERKEEQRRKKEQQRDEETTLQTARGLTTILTVVLREDIGGARGSLRATICATSDNRGASRGRRQGDRNRRVPSDNCFNSRAIGFCVSYRVAHGLSELSNIAFRCSISA